MHPRAAAPGDRHTARAGVFSRRRLLAGPRMHKLRNLVAVRSEKTAAASQVKSSHCGRPEPNYMYTKAEMKCQFKSSRYPHGEHGARDLSAWGSALPGAPPVGNPWQ